MGEKDSGEKLLEDYADVFADIINVLAFHGERLLQEDHIISGPTASIYKDACQTLREHLRDIMKYDIKEKLLFAVIGIENQGAPDMDMVFRIMGYDYGAYRIQIDSTDKKRYPVFTVVLYFGLKPWNAPKDLYEALDFTEEVPYQKYLPELIPNMKLNIIEVAFLSEEIRQQFTSDFRIVADYFCGLREGREEEFFNDIREFKHVEAMLEFFRIFSGDKRYEDIRRPIIEKAEKGERISMCTLMDAAINRGMSKGLAEGELKGEIKGEIKGKLEAYGGLIDEGLLTAEHAAEKMGITTSEFIDKRRELAF